MLPVFVNNVLDNVRIHYAGAYNLYANLRIDTSSITVTDSTISVSDNYGIDVQGGASPTITGCTISSNSRDGVRLYYSHGHFEGNTIRNNGYAGIYTQNSHATIINNTISIKISV